MRQASNLELSGHVPCNFLLNLNGKRSSGTPSEIRFGGGGSAVIDRHAIAFLADDLGHTDMPLLSLPTVPCDEVVKPGALPRLHEGVRVLRRHMDLELLAAFDQAKAFYDVQLLGVRGAEIVDK